MKKYVPYLVVFAIGLGLGLGDQSPPETRTVFIEKPVTREVVETKVIREVEPMPSACKEAISSVGGVVEPIDTLAATAGEIQRYAHSLGVEAYDSDVPAINRTTVKLRLAKDAQGSAVIAIEEALQYINNKFIECQKVLVEGSD